jgi:murein DD-endopeptidase MepM/ murein hydrolase activator NlpD
MNISHRLSLLYKKRPGLLLLLPFAAIVFATLAFMPTEHGQHVQASTKEVPPAGPCLLEGDAARGIHTCEGEIVYGHSFRGALDDAGIPGCAADTIQRLLGVAGFDFSMCKPGQIFTAQTDSAGALKAFRYVTDRLNSYWILPDSLGYLQATTHTLPTQRELVSLEGTVETSVWNAMREMGEKPELVVAYEEVLGYDMDFIFDPRKGDRFRVLVDRIMLDGEIIGYGNIVAASYMGDLVGDVKGYWFRNDSTKTRGWFAPNGENLQKAFKRAPLPILKVTSAYGMRRHPISGKNKMHTGIDYGAPTGTPVWSIGAGTVTFAGWRGGYGKLVEISHGGNIKTRYAHLSVIAVKRGQSVRQRQTIGKVGSTGYSTGPHLHFEFLVNGKFTQPRRVKNPPLKKLPDALMPAFRAEMQRIDALWERTIADSSPAIAAR